MNRTSLHSILVVIFLSSCFEELQAQGTFSSFERAKLHPITSDRPAIDFFEGPSWGTVAWVLL